MNFILDAALIELPEKFNLNPKFVNPVCLPNNFGEIDESWNHKKFTISGWGNVNSKRKFARKLQFAQKSIKKCSKYLYLKMKTEILLKRFQRSDQAKYTYIQNF